MSGGDPPARVEIIGLGVRYRVPHERILSFKEYVLRRLKRALVYQDLWALRELDFEVRPGEIFGVVGRNGAGKSTLLKVMSRVLQPTVGRIVVRGRVAPLLQLGAGFHPDMTGKENVFINSTMLGYSRAAVRERMDEVIDFSELQEFIDVPVRAYSSGMLARLGFAVATLFQPDLLLIDEVLAVGDGAFQKKCLARIKGFRDRGSAVVLVSHGIDTVSAHCDRAVWVEGGRMAALGAVDEVLDRYRDFLAQADAARRAAE